MSFLTKILKKEEKKKADKKTSVEGLVSAQDSTAKVVYKAVGVLKNVHVSEKSNNGATISKYVFAVQVGSSKFQIKKAIEDRYKVLVEKINVLNMPGKTRQRGRQIGFKPGIKKAVVTLKEGQTIELQ